MKSREFHALQVKGLRNVQKARRTLETYSNKLERRLARLIASKRILTSEQMLDADTDLSWITDSYKKLIAAAGDAFNLVEG